MLQAEEHHRAPLWWVLAPYLAGLAAAGAGATTAGAFAAVLAALTAGGGILAAGRTSRSGTTAWACALVCAAFLAGMVRMGMALNEQPRWRELPPREVVLELEITRVLAPPRLGNRRSCLARVLHAPPLVSDLAGQRLHFAAPPPGAVTPGSTSGFVRSMRLRVHGVITPLRRDEAQPGSFDAYLLNAGVRFRLGRVGALEVTQPPALLPHCWHLLGAHFEKILRQGLPPHHPATAAHVAMFLGRTSELSEEQAEAFLRSGTMHIFAISGLHVGVIAGCVAGLLSLARVPPRLGILLGWGALWVFVEATGGSPSARRAFLMVFCLGLGQLLRRPANPLAALLAAAAGVLAWDPLSLFSASFQFSYAVVAMLLLYGVPLRNWFLQLWEPWKLLPKSEWRWWQHTCDGIWRGFVSGASISIAATLVSTPLSIAAFGLASPGSVLANLALVGVAGVSIAAGFASLVCGLLGFTPLSVLFNHASALVLWGVDHGAQVAARVPGMFFQAGFPSAWMAPTLSAGVIALALAGYAIGWRRKPLVLLGPPLALVTALVFLVTPNAPGEQSTTMKSAYELAMERLRKADPDSGPALSAEQKAQLAEIDRVYQGKIAEREIFLRQRLAEAQSRGEAEESDKILKQIAAERTRLEEEREDGKNRVRRPHGPNR